MRILLVEDDAANARVASEIFRCKGHEVDCAFNGTDALRAGQSQTYDAALIDVFLPDAEGFLVAEMLRGMQPQLRCVLVTGHFMPEGRERAEKVGAHFRTKPLDFEEVEKLLSFSKL